MAPTAAIRSIAGATEGAALAAEWPAAIEAAPMVAAPAIAAVAIAGPTDLFGCAGELLATEDAGPTADVPTAAGAFVTLTLSTAAGAFVTLTSFAGGDAAMGELDAAMRELLLTAGADSATEPLAGDGAFATLEPSVGGAVATVGLLATAGIGPTTELAGDGCIVVTLDPFADGECATAELLAAEGVVDPTVGVPALDGGGIAGPTGGAPALAGGDIVGSTAGVPALASRSIVGPAGEVPALARRGIVGLADGVSVLARRGIVGPADGEPALARRGIVGLVDGVPALEGGIAAAVEGTAGAAATAEVLPADCAAEREAPAIAGAIAAPAAPTLFECDFGLGCAVAVSGAYEYDLTSASALSSGSCAAVAVCGAPGT